MLNYELLTGLAAVISEGSFEAAAKLLNVTPSAISQRIKLLEERLGALLIIRGKPCTATEYGYALFKHAEKIQFLEKNLLETLPKAAETTDDEPLLLRLAVNADSIGTWFPIAMGKAIETDNYLFDIVVEDQEQTSNLLRQGNVIAAITSESKAIQGFQNTFLGSLRYVATSSPAFHEKHFKENGVTPATLKKAPSITFNRNDNLPTKWLKKTVGKNIHTQSSWVPSLSGYINSCENGIGWGLHPQLLVEDSISSGKMIELIPGSYIDIPLYWQYCASYGKVMADFSESVIEIGKDLLQN